MLRAERGEVALYTVMKYLQDHIDERLTIEELAREFGYSKWYFCELFKRFTGMTVVEYLRAHRMQKAALEILDGDRVLDVALRYGYDTLSGFNKAFLKQFGCMPKEFKHQHTQYHISYQERRSKMLHLSNRCTILRENVVLRKPINDRIHGVHSLLFHEGVTNAYAAGIRNNTQMLAQGIAHVVLEAPPIVERGELIVGYNYADTPYQDWELPNDDETGREQLGRCGFSKERIEQYFSTREDIALKWQTVPVKEMSETEQMLETEWAAIGRCIAANHTVLDYNAVLQYGFEGLLQKVEAAEEQNGDSPLYRAMKTLCLAGCRMGERYADHIRTLMDDPTLDDTRRKELYQMEQNCRNVPQKPAATFWEAVQSLWFAHIINTWEDNINANSLGRLDQILYPYYERDIAKGILTKEEAFELICCLWLKLYRDYDVQQSCIGGCKKDGSDAVNELSYLMLDATEELDFIRCLSVRFTAKTDRAFLRRALEVVGHVQKGVPFFFNDDVLIPALVAKGVSLEDARDYTQIGCVETVIPGKSNPHAVTGETNLLKALEYAFDNGQSMMHPDWTPGIQTGELAAFTSYEKLEQAVFAQIRHILDVTCKRVLEHTVAAMTNVPRPYKSLLTEGCIDSGLDFNQHGAKYDYYQIMLGGVPNLADSLMVIKTLVYEQGKYSLCYLVDQLKQNFPDEAFRLECIHKVPKFGNDVWDVDQLAAKIIDYACDVLEELETVYGLSFHAQPFTFLWMVDHGKATAASADGRRKGEIIAYSVSPMQGRDFNGFTALMNSLCQLPGKRCAGTTSAIVEVDPKLFSDSNIDRFVDILIASAQNGLSNVQFNTVDAQTLLDAQKNPEKHANLAVRVSGFSQKFHLLSKELQDHIIGRTKHQCL